jgi:hypothetical protein
MEVKHFSKKVNRKVSVKGVQEARRLEPDVNVMREYKVSMDWN